MLWFLKKKKPRQTTVEKSAGDLWVKCKSCGEQIYKDKLDDNFGVCHECGYHFRIDVDAYISLLLDEGSFEIMDENIRSTDPLKFKDTERYPTRLKDAIKKTGRTEAVTVGMGKLDGRAISCGFMDFQFIGGSMGAVVGERVKRAILRAADRGVPCVMVCASGGARMQESILSLMQMAKTSAALAKLDEAGQPYINILTHPTMAGVMASFAALGDVNIAEPGSLLGFAGPRVIKETIASELPKGFQRADFLKEHGFVDVISHRHELRANLIKLLGHFTANK